MKTRLENILVDCLCDTLHVMLCSESSGAVCTINSLIGRYPLFNFLKARSCDAMKLYFRQIQAWHCLVFDSRCTFSEEFFTTVRNIPFWVPVILLADSVSEDYLRTHGMTVESNGNIVINSGSPDGKADHTTHKKCVIVCPLRSFKRLFPMIQLHSIRKKLMPNMLPEELVQKAIDLLFRQNPLTVEEWSATLESTPRKFQRMFKQYTNYSPKKLIALYHAYRIAFETMGRHEELGKGLFSAYILDDRSKKRVMEYVLSRRSQLLSV